MAQAPGKATANAIDSLRCSAGRAMDKYQRMKEIALNPSAQTSGLKTRHMLSIGMGALFTIVALSHTGLTIKSAVDKPTSTIVTDGYTENLQFPNITICDTFASFINESELIDNYFKRRRSGASSANFAVGSKNAFDILEWLALSFIVPDLPEEQTEQRLKRIQTYLGRKSDDINYQQIFAQLERRMSTKNMAMAYRSLVAQHRIPCKATFKNCTFRGREFECCGEHGFLTQTITQHGPCWLANFEKIESLRAKLLFSDSNNFEMSIARWADPDPREVYAKFPSEETSAAEVSKKSYFLIYLRDAAISTGNYASSFPAWSEINIGLEALNIDGMVREKKCRRNPPTGPHFYREFERTECMRNVVLLTANENSPCQIPFLQLVNPSYFNQLASSGHMLHSNRPQCPIFESCRDKCQLAPTHMAALSLTEESLHQCRDLCKRILYSVNGVQVGEDEEETVRNVTVLSIGFHEQNYMIFTEFVLFTWYDYIGLIGGIWGIWMGASVIDIMQFVEGLARWAVKKCGF